MASTSEVGHAKNAANFSAGIQILQEMGTIYNPSNSNILIENIIPVSANLSAVLTTLNTQMPIYKNTVADREIAIEPLGKITTRVGNYAKSLQISDKDKQNIEAAVKKVRGDAKDKKVNPEVTPTNEISNSQMSYDSRIANFEKLILLVASHPEYIPNENDVRLQTLNAYHQQLATLSTAVNAAGNTIITARADRNQILYYADTNIIELVKLIKTYLKSLPAQAQPYYKAFVKLKFSDIKA